VDVRSDVLLADERAVGARRNGDVVAVDELEHAQRVRGRLVERLIAGDRGYSDQLHLGRGEGQQERNRVVVAWVAVEDDWLGRHRRQYRRSE
jgi:hypothetical protein